MDQETLNEFREIITNKISMLLSHTNQTVDKMLFQEGKFPDPSDRGSMEADRNLELRIRDRERKLILKLKRALARIDNGSYGYCEVCGEPIGLERLRARPETSMCIDCKEEMELREKRVRNIGAQILKK